MSVEGVKAVPGIPGKRYPCLAGGGAGHDQGRPVYVGDCGLTIPYTLDPRAGNLVERGIVLALTPEKDGILAGPKEWLTDEIRSSIHADRDHLIRKLLIAEAFAYYEAHVRATGTSSPSGGPVDPAVYFESDAATAGYAELSNNDADLNEALQSAGLDELKQELRLWLKRGLVAYHERLGSLRADTLSEEADGTPAGNATAAVEPLPAQPTLVETKPNRAEMRHFGEVKEGTTEMGAS